MKLKSELLCVLAIVSLLAGVYWLPTIEVFFTYSPNPWHRVAYAVLWLVTAVIFIHPKIIIPNTLYVVALGGLCASGWIGAWGDYPFFTAMASLLLFLSVFAYRMYSTRREGRRVRR